MRGGHRRDRRRRRVRRPGPRRRRREERGEDVDHGGLAGAVRAEQGEHAALGDLEVDAVEDDGVAEGLAQTGGGDGAGHANASFRSALVARRMMMSHSSPAGSVFALLGPNGAGKTTTVHILSTLVAPDAGTVTVAGHDLARDPDGVRAAIGLTGQFAAVDGLLTGEENLRLMAGLRHLGSATAGAGSPNCWNGSTSPTPPVSRSPPIRAGCTGDWISP